MHDQTEKRKYADKYETVEDLEKSYKEIQSVLSKKEEAHREELKRIEQEKLKIAEEKNNIEQGFKIPDEYKIEVPISEEKKNYFISRAKEAGLTQSQFNKLISKSIEEEKGKKEEIENELGEDLEKINNFIDQNFSDTFSKSIKKYTKTDKELAKALVEERKRKLNISIDTTGYVNKNNDKEELTRLYNESLKDPSKYGEYLKQVVKSAGVK